MFECRTRASARLLPLLLCALLAACATLPNKQPPNMLLLGEVHDNPAGHRQRYEYLRGLVDVGWRPAIVMEQFDRERADDLRSAMQGCRDADCVITKAGGKRWDWPLYRPVIDLALQHQLAVLAGNVSRADAARVTREGVAAAISPEDAAAFSFQDSITQQLLSAQRDEVERGHCGKAHKEMLTGFANAQIARDVWMAKLLLENSRQGAVLIVGNGHVRRDWGVPYWLRLRSVKDIVSVGYVEASTDKLSTEFDVVHTVRPHQRPDPCDSLKIQALPSGSSITTKTGR